MDEGQQFNTLSGVEPGNEESSPNRTSAFPGIGGGTNLESFGGNLTSNNGLLQDDNELQHLLKQAAIARQQENDYQSLADQIRCLKQRQYGQLEEEQLEQQSYFNKVKEAASYQDSQQFELRNLQNQLLQEQMKHERMRDHYVQLNKREGEMQNQMDALQKDQKLNIDRQKRIDGEVKAKALEKHGLQNRFTDLQAEVNRIQSQRDKIGERRSQLQGEIDSINTLSRASQTELDRLRAQIVKLDSDNIKRQDLISSTQRSFEELVEVLEGLKHHNQNLKKESAQKQESIISLHRETAILGQGVKKESIAVEAANLDVRQSQVTAESRSHELTTERENEACILRHQCDLKERVSELNHQRVLLQTEQDELNRQLTTFAEENERIRHRLNQRDCEMQRRQQASTNHRQPLQQLHAVNKYNVTDQR